MADKWLIANNDEPNKALAQHGWTPYRRGALFFMSERDAQAHIDANRVRGHTTRATADDEGPAQGAPGAALPDYDPYGLSARRA